MPKDYESYSTEEFLDDPFFIEWVRHQTPGSVLFWSQWINSAPANVRAVQEAEWQLRAMLSAERIEAAEADEQQVWQQINKEIGGEQSVVPSRKTWWMAAAAVLVLLAGGWWMMKGSNSTQQPSVAAAPNLQVPDIAPGGNKAILTLADGTQVILDSANNGAITKQGNVTIIKLDDGQLAYNASSTSTSALTYNTVTTPRGGQYQLVLSDGTKVWLNAASSLKFPTAFAGSERRVEMTGEGYFEVAASHEPSGAKGRFIVSAGNMDVEVLGTHFNINAYADEEAVKTTLLEGKVRASVNGQAVILLPGKQASMNPSGLTVQEADLEQVMAWKNGRFLFNSTDIKIVMRQIARWYDVDVSYTNQIDGTISGNIARSENIGQIKKLLEATGKIDLEINGKNIIVKAK